MWRKSKIGTKKPGAFSLPDDSNDLVYPALRMGTEGRDKRPAIEIAREFSIRPQRKLLRSNVSNRAFILFSSLSPL
jgi:hypothetical protein